LAIDFNGPSLEHHGAQVNEGQVQLFGGHDGDVVIQGEGSVPTPAIESPVYNDPLSLVVLDEAGPIVPGPEIISGTQVKINLCHVDLGSVELVGDVVDLACVVGDDVNAFAFGQGGGHGHPAGLYIFCTRAICVVVRPLQPGALVRSFLTGHGVLRNDVGSIESPNEQQGKEQEGRSHGKKVAV
jgi:hypothetical protein